MIVIGAYIEKTGIFDIESTEIALGLMLKRKNLLQLNLDAIQKGIDYVKNM